MSENVMEKYKGAHTYMCQSELVVDYNNSLIIMKVTNYHISC